MSSEDLRAAKPRSGGSTFTDSVRVVPGHCDLYGKRARQRDLVRLVERYPAFEWLSFLSRVQNMLWGPRTGEKDWFAPVFAGALSEDIRRRLREFERASPKTMRLGLFFERQLSTLQELVILYAPEEGTRKLDNESGRDDFGRALFMTRDAMIARRRLSSGIHTIGAYAYQDYLRSCLTNPLIFAARAYDFYGLGHTSQSQELNKYLELFSQATNVGARDFLLGALRTLIFELREPADLASGWSPVHRPGQLKNPIERRMVEAFQAVRMKPLQEVRTLITLRERRRPIRDWNLIALSEAPLIEFPNRGAFVINHTALGRTMFDGVRHAILGAALAKRLPSPFDDPASVNSLFTGLFEQYVARILEASAPNRTIRIPAANDMKRADLIVWYSDKVLVVECKGGSLPAVDNHKYMDLIERKRWLERIGLAKATAQIASTVDALRSGALKCLGMPNFDWTITPVVPVIVTLEPIPHIPRSWETLFGSLDRRFRRLRSAGPVGRLRILSTDEIEMVPGLHGIDDFATILLKWGASPTEYELPWTVFLHRNDVKFSGETMSSRAVKMWRILASDLGLNPDLLGPARRPSGATV